MNEFMSALRTFLGDMFTYAMIAIFIENTIFSRSIGVSTVLFSVRKKYNIFLLGLIMTCMLAVSSIAVYFIFPLLKPLSYSY